MPDNFQKEKDSRFFLFSLISAFSELFPSLKMNCICYQQNSNLIIFHGLSLVIWLRPTNTYIGVYYLSFLCHFTTGCLSHTLVNSTTSWKTPSGLQIHGLSFLTRSSLAHNSILLCVFLPLLLSHYTINIICKHVGTDFFVCHSLHPLSAK